MDTRRFIIAMTLSLAVMYGYTYFIAKRQKPATTQPVPASTQAAAPAAATEPGAAPQTTAGYEAKQPASAPTTAGVWQVRGAKEARQVTLGTNTPAGTFDTQAVLTNQGAAVERILLVAKKKKGKYSVYRYAKTVAGLEPYPLIEPLVSPDGQTAYSWATDSIRIGQPEATVRLTDVPWNVEVRQIEEGPKKGAYEARFWVDILNADQPVVRIVKRYVLAPKSFGIDMGLTFESLNNRPVRLVVAQGGPVGILRADPRSDYRKVFVVNMEKNRPVPTQWTHAQLVKHEGTAVVGSANPITWTALVDKYFAAISAPVKSVGADSAIDETRIFTDSTEKTETGNLLMDMVSPPITVKPQKPAELHYDLYAGPKDTQVFAENPSYVTRNYALLNSSEYTWCTFSSLGEVMTGLLHWLNRWIWPHNYGLAIIILVLLVRLIMHPLTKHQQVTMTQMQQRQAEVAPKIDALKKRHANDRQQLQVETMRVYREAGINPASQVAGCLPMLIQLPIWVALYSALNYDIQLWHAPFIWWIRDLSAPDALYAWTTPVNIPLFSWFIGPVTKFNLLPVLLGAAMYFQQKFTPKPTPPAGGSSDQANQQQQMQKMMGFMMIFMGLLFYNMPSGLCLYIMASSAFGVAEQIRIRKHIEERRNRPPSAKPARRMAWLDKIMEGMEKKARESHTVRKDK